MSRPKSEAAQLGQVAHDLRSALNTIVGWAELLRSDALDDSLRARAAATIVTQARHLARELDDAMDLWRVDVGVLSVECGPAELPALLRNAVDKASPFTQPGHIRWQIDAGSEAAPVWCDPERFTQALALVLSHAAACSPPDATVSISVSTAPGRVDVHVHDEGAPLGDDTLALVFGEHGTGEPNRTRQRRPFDAGLLLARHLLELQGGALVPLHDGRPGASFAVTIAHAATRRAGTPAAAPLAGLRVLVVEDEPDAREALTALLRLHGAEVIAAGSVGEALDEAMQHAVDLLLSDIAMPDRDGYELLRELRAQPQFAHLPAAALTAYAGTADRQRALAAGYQIHLTKPVEPDRLLSAVRSLASTAAH